MKRYLFALMLALFVVGPVSAQMTDEEVVQFVQEEHEAGKSQQTILLDLRRKGVKTEQLLRLKEQYEAAQAASSETSGSTPSAVGDRARKPNGDTQSKSDDAEIVGNVATATK